MKIAISFCNQTVDTGYPNLAIVDTSIDECRWIDLPVPNDGVTGLTQTVSHILALYKAPNESEQANGVVIVNKSSLSVVHQQALPELLDPHSCFVDHSGSFYAVSTGTEEVLRYRFDSETLTLALIGPIWQPYAARERVKAISEDAVKAARQADLKRLRQMSKGLANGSLMSPRIVRRSLGSHHVNAVFVDSEDVFISAFGPKEGELYNSARNGYITRLSSAKKIEEGIQHPHSVVVDAGNVLFCESVTQSVRCAGKGVVLSLDKGYIRGLAVSKDFVAVGASSGRRISKSTGRINNIADPGVMESCCYFKLFRKLNQTDCELSPEAIFTKDFSTTKTEIYDLLFLSENA